MVANMARTIEGDLGRSALARGIAALPCLGFYDLPSIVPTSLPSK